MARLLVGARTGVLKAEKTLVNDDRSAFSFVKGGVFAHSVPEGKTELAGEAVVERSTIASRAAGIANFALLGTCVEKSSVRTSAFALISRQIEPRRAF